ncbi:MAG: hypothetical protein WD356_09770 [Pseudomonadales bacterium]
MNNLRHIMTSVAVTALFSAQALAATDGSVGTTSSGTSQVSLDVADRIQISNVEDIALGTYGGTGDLNENMSYCVYRNGGGDYELTLTTDQGVFEVADGTDTIPFAVQVDGDNDASDGASIAYNTASTAFTGSNAGDCNGADNGAMYVNFSEANLQAAPTSTYQATVTLLVEPI